MTKRKCLKCMHETSGECTGKCKGIDFKGAVDWIGNMVQRTVDEYMARGYGEVEFKTYNNWWERLR